MLARRCLASICVIALGCGEAPSLDAPRLGQGGAGGSALDGGLGFGCLCPTGEECADDGSCVSICGERPACVFGGSAQCCGVDMACQAGTCVTDCGAQIVCNGVCCEGGQMCHEGSCVVQCDDPAQLCGADDELCCGIDEACIGGACVPVLNPCELGEDCEVDELCEPSLGVCIPRDSVEVCEFRPPVGAFEPTIGCRWTPPAALDASSEQLEIEAMSEVVMTPAVANLTDDNADGATDVLDTPDIVFVSFDYGADGCCTRRGVVL